MSFLINGWRLDSSLNAIIHAETAETKRLGEYQFALISLLLEHPDQVLTREELTQHAWKTRVVGHNSLPNAIHALRNALGDDGKHQQIIKTIPKKGYLLDGSFLSPDLSIEEPTHEPDEIDEIDEVKDSEASHPLPASPAEQHAGESAPAKKSKRNRPWAMTSGVLVLLVAAGLGWYVEKMENAPATQQITEVPDTRLSAKNTQVFALDIPGDLEHGVSTRQIPSSMQNQLTRLDDVLEKRQAKMQIRYFLSLNVLSLNINIANQCDVHSQLMMDIHDWAQYPDKLAALVYNESVRTLNDLPNCP